jgi:hypothetical protein
MSSLDWVKHVEIDDTFVLLEALELLDGKLSNGNIPASPEYIERVKTLLKSVSEYFLSIPKAPDDSKRLVSAIYSDTYCELGSDGTYDVWTEQAHSRNGHYETIGHGKTPSEAWDMAAEILRKAGKLS